MGRRAVSVAWGMGVVFSLGGPTAAFAQPRMESSSRTERADSLLAAQAWSDAEAAYREVLEEDPENGLARFRLGYTLYRLERYEDAVAAWRRIEATFRPALTRFNIGLSLAHLGDADGALEALEEAVAAGFDEPRLLRSNRAFDRVRADPRFQAVVRRAEENADAGCEGKPGFDRLDFWLGEWDVRVNGRTVGSNRIEKVLDGCAVTERWVSAAGGEGRSLFYYTPASGRWKQVWVTGRATEPGGVKEKELVDTFEDGGVRFQGEILLENGGSYLDRTTLTPLPDGRVRQVIETSRDGGVTWRIGFDAVYVARPGSP